MKKILPPLLGGLLLAACAPSTPQSRIERNPSQFAALSKKEQELVKDGKLQRGMSREAVFLSWGAPAHKFEGSRDRKVTERWDYEGTRPVFTSVYSGWGGFGYGGYGYGRYSGLGIGLGPEIAYMPYRTGSVWFLGNKVESWERMR